MPWSRVRQTSDGTWRCWLLPGPEDRSGRRGILRCRGWSRMRPGEPIGAVSGFLPDFLACGNSAASCRSYGHDLLRWFGFLSAVGVPWDGGAGRCPRLRPVAAGRPQPGA